AITQGGPGNATWVAAWYTYRAAFQPPFNVGLGSASAWVMALILAVAGLAYARLVGRRLEPCAVAWRLSWRRRALLWLANLAAIAFLLAPLAPVVLASLQSEKAIQRDVRALLPREITLANFQLILSGGATRGPIFEQVTYLPKSVDRFPAAFANSLIVACAVTLLTLVLGSLSAYTVARLNLRWVKAMLSLSVASRLVPLIVLMVPLYVLFRTYGLLNSLTGVVIAEVGFLVPYAVLILAPYLASLPAELEDAARIDGCTRFGAFRRIVLPLATPGL